VNNRHIGIIVIVNNRPYASCIREIENSLSLVQESESEDEDPVIERRVSNREKKGVPPVRYGQETKKV
jgi:hypothetical protein